MARRTSTTALAAAGALLLAAPASAIDVRRSAKSDGKLLWQSKKKTRRSRAFLHKDPMLPGFYHSSEQIASEIRDLAANCPGMSIETKSGSSDDGAYSVSVDVATFTKPGATPNNRFFMLFGEHARELISPESSLHLLQSLCGRTDGISQEKIDKVLGNSQFQVVVNANPNSRKRVESGEWCLRVNGQGVDLNRNWDEKWVPQEQDMLQSPDTNPGPKAFSEPETRIFKELVASYNPTSFLTIHSGTKGMYMPWAYDMVHLAKKNGPAMYNMLKTIDKEYCQCPFGAAGKEVGYECPGTCLDYVYDHQKVEYSFAFEIYTWHQDWESLEERFEQKYNAPSDFFQTRMQSLALTKDQEEFDECFARFNPIEEADFTNTLNTWTNVYLDLADNIATDMKKNGF